MAFSIRNSIFSGTEQFFPGKGQRGNASETRPYAPMSRRVTVVGAEALGASLGEAATGADLGGSSKYSKYSLFQRKLSSLLNIKQNEKSTCINGFLFQNEKELYWDVFDQNFQAILNILYHSSVFLCIFIVVE